MSRNSKLSGYIKQLQNYDEEIKKLNDAKSVAFKDAKGDGYDPKIMRAVLRIQKIGLDKHQEYLALLDAYLAELR